MSFPNLLGLAKKLLFPRCGLASRNYQQLDPSILKVTFCEINHTMVRWRKEKVLVNLWLIRIHFLIIKRVIAKGVSSWIMKFFH
jgi:hypothetical protein